MPLAKHTSDLCVFCFADNGSVGIHGNVGIEEVPSPLDLGIALVYAFWPAGQVTSTCFSPQSPANLQDVFLHFFYLFYGSGNK